MTSHRFARSNLRARQTPLENFPVLAEGGNRAVLHDGNLVRYAQGPIRWVMMMTVVLAAFIHSMASNSMHLLSDLHLLDVA